MPRHPTILVLVPTDFGFARAVLRGIRAFSQEHGGWFLRCGTVPGTETTLRKVRPKPGGGMIGFFGQAWQEAVAEEFQAPVVNVSHRLPESRFPRVLPDNVEVGRRAARHLIDQGFRRFGYCRRGDRGYSMARRRGFQQVLSEAGHPMSDIPFRPADAIAWFAKAQTPLGVFCESDGLAQQVIDIAHEADLALPEQVAVVGADNDEHVCLSTTPAITSVDTRGFHVGYEAASLLARLIAGDPAPDPPQPILVPCGEVVTRLSTDTVALADPDLNIAMRHIREHACQGVRVADILKHLTISRRTLEKRFKSATGRTLHEEIRRVQMQTARTLLIETRLKIPEVAERSGFCDRHAFTRVFGEVEGMPPGRFRELRRTT